MSVDDSGTLIKAILMGNVAVGKTTLRKSYMGESFTKSYLPTLGVDISVKTIEVEDKEPISFQIWDMAGHIGFEKVRPAFFSGAAGGLAVLDITRPNTLEALEKWISELWQYNAARKIRKVPIIIIANKIDLRNKKEGSLDRESCIERIHTLEQNLGIEEGTFPFIETSAVMGENVEKAFYLLLEKIVKFFNYEL